MPENTRLRAARALGIYTRGTVFWIGFFVLATRLLFVPFLALSLLLCYPVRLARVLGLNK